NGESSRDEQGAGNPVGGFSGIETGERITKSLSTFGLRSFFVIGHWSLVIHRRSPGAQSQRRSQRRNQQSPARQAENFRVWPVGESRFEKDHPPDERQKDPAGIL